MRSKIAKLSNLFEIMSTQPREFYGRVVTMVESRIDPYLRKAPRYEPVEWRALVDRLSECLGVNVEDTLREDELKQVEDEVVRGLKTMPPDAPFLSDHNGDLRLGHLCYALA